MSEAEPARPLSDVIEEYADQAVQYVETALALRLEYDSDTLPVLDHYLRNVPLDKKGMLHLIVLTAGAYFGEVIRRRMGGRWEGEPEEPGEWRLVLPTGISFCPAGYAAAAIARRDDIAELDTGLDTPPRLAEYLEEILERMGEVTDEVYYSLCGRLDTLEHIEESLIGIAAHLREQQN